MPTIIFLLIIAFLSLSDKIILLKYKNLLLWNY
jgi:hypothetical protein